MKRWIISGIALAAGLWLATGCAPDTTAPTLVPRSVAGNSAVVSDPTYVPPTPILNAFTDVECLDCHTDQQRLTTLAVAEEKSESLSSGPG